eukprot:XP_019928726.1 PREDICTED: uncharacterized protein LOC105342845 [Crassostrea gigas]
MVTKYTDRNADPPNVNQDEAIVSSAVIDCPEDEDVEEYGLPSVGDKEELSSVDINQELGPEDNFSFEPVPNIEYREVFVYRNGVTCCDQYVTLGGVPAGTTCHLYDFCTGVRCCSDIPLLDRSINTWLIIDHCNYKLSVGFEKLSINVSLRDYEMGKQKDVIINGVFRIRYRIEDLIKEQKYLVNMNIKICLEANKTCLIDVSVFKNTKLPQKPCEWRTNFIDEAFSLDAWKQTRGILSSGLTDEYRAELFQDLEGLTDEYRAELFQDLGLSQFLYEDNRRCSSSESPYIGAVENWNNECNGTFRAPLPSLAGKDVTCHISSSCAALQCCVQVPIISTTFSTKLEVDPCNFRMTVEIDQLKFTKNLFDYEWGQEEQVWLFGVVRIIFSVFDLHYEGYYIMNLNLEVCLEAAKVPLCEAAIQPLKDFYLPKKLCQWDAPFSIQGFSLAAWQIAEGVANTMPIDSSVVDNLFSDLSVAALVSSPPCSWTDNDYLNAITNFQQYCPEAVQTSLSSITDRALCTVSSSCTNIRCCVNIPLLNRTFEVGMELDYSYMSLRVYVEKMTRRQSLIGYQFGQEETLSVHGVFKLSYKLNNLEDGNLLDMSLRAEASFNDGGPCAVNLRILHNALIPKLNRKWFSQHKSRDFSLSKWKVEKSVTGPLERYQISELLEMLSLQPYMKSSPCSRQQATYSSAGANGWQNVSVLHPAGVPLYFTVHVSNEAGVSVPATCKLDTFDVTIPGGRMAEAFVSTSNPNVLKAVVTVYEDSPIKQTMVAVGYGKNTWAEQIIRWTPTTVAANIVDYDVGHDPLNLKVITLFASGKAGRLVGRGISVGDFYQITTKEECAAKCNGLHATKCLSFNYDFGSSGHCELLEAIEGHDHKISRQGHYMHYEKLGVGSNRGFQYNNLQLPHDHIMYFNFRIVNSLGFENILSSKPILTDYTPPDPTSWQINITSDRLETIKCLDVIPDDRDDWEERFCEGVNPKTKNHRIVIDGEGSETVYNGHTYKNDLTYTRANRYISANWDGIYDNETGILGYSVTAGESICEEKIKQHHDPHAHLFDRSQWTHTVMMTPLEEPYTILPDGPYYITVRAINNIQYGGALSTSICHSSPYIVDNSPPLVYEVYNVRYDEHKFNLSLSHNSSDPNSGVIRNDLCLGKSTRDCDELMWVPMEYNQNMTYLKKITEGVPIWVKVTVVNNVDLRTIGRCDSPLIVDNSPPVAGTVNDGEIYGLDLDFTRYEDKICSNWQSFYDPQSGIAMYMVGVGSSPNQTDVANLTRFSSKSHVACVELKPDKYLSHNQKYFTTVYAYNGGHKQQNVSAISNGVLVDLTKPVPGQIVDGNSVNFTDMKYTTSQAKVDLQWKSFFDPESNISHYDVKVYRAGNLSQDYEEIRDWTKFDASTSSVKWLNFHNYHKDIIKTSLRTTNRALNEIVNTTDGFIVDLTPPQLHYLWDGDQEKDREFQSDISQLTASFKYTDKESGVDHIKLEIFEMFHGTRTQKYPEIHNEWMELPNGDMTSYTWTGLVSEEWSAIHHESRRYQPCWVSRFL